MVTADWIHSIVVGAKRGRTQRDSACSMRRHSRQVTRATPVKRVNDRRDCKIVRYHEASVNRIQA